MNCDLAHDLLQQCLDGSPIESPDWLAHLRDCTECRALASAGRRLQDGLQLLDAPRPPAELAARIAEAVRLDRWQARRRSRLRWAVGVALAAGLLLALTLRFGWHGRPTGTETHPSESVAKNTSAPQTKPAPTLRESAAELGEVFAALTSQTADETVGQTRQLVPSVPSPLWDGFEIRPTMKSPTRPLREAGESVSEGFEPVTTSARRAVGLFLRELPMETEAKGL
ncbi:MAG: anti-sigma factor family protein [Gemmataceae bacterium]